MFGWKHGGRDVVLALFLLSICTAAMAENRPDEVIVRLKPGRAAQLSVMNAGLGSKTRRKIDNLRFYTLKLPKGADLQKTIDRLSKNPNVEYVGPNHVLRITLTPNDPLYTDGVYVPEDYLFLSELYLEVYGILPAPLDPVPQWGLYNDGYNNNPDWFSTERADIHAEEAWDIETGSPNVVIADIDTGVDYTHPDLSAKMWTNPGEIPGNGIDDDHNGKIDDWRGWDFVNDTNDPMDDFVDPNTGDPVHHGTFTSSVAAGAGNDGQGMAGVAWGCRVMPIKVIGGDGTGSEDVAALGIVYAVDMGAKVLNMSFAGENTPLLRAACDYAWQHGALAVAASGNDGLQTSMYPAAYENVLSVGASNQYDEICTDSDWFMGGSNYGAYLDVVAPGNYILGAGGASGYQAQPGTSAAAPFVSGIAALIWSKYPGWSNAQVKYQIEHTADDCGTTGYDIYTGWGRVNAYRALAEAVAVTPSIAATKSVADGKPISLKRKVLATGSSDIPNRLYVQDEDRSAGILLYFPGGAPTGFSVGDRVDVFGVAGSVAGERAILSAGLTKDSSGPIPRPLGTLNRMLGGGPYALQGGVVNKYTAPRVFAIGCNNIGLLTTTYGRVTASDYGFFYIDDGSHLVDGPGRTGVYVAYGDSIAPPDIGQLVTVTGISSCEFVPNSTTIMRRVLRPRTQADIRPM